MALLSSNLRSLIEARLGGVGGRRLRRGLGGGGRQGLREPEGPRGGRGGGRGGGVHPAGDVDWLGLGPNLGCRVGASSAKTNEMSVSIVNFTHSLGEMRSTFDNNTGACD